MIIKNTNPAQYLILNTAVINDDRLTIKARSVLIYLLSKPKDWQLRISDIKRKLDIGTHSVRSALKQLQAAGYAIYHRLKTGHTVWTIFDTPQNQQNSDVSTAITPQVENPHVVFRPVLVNIETAQNKETTTKTLEIEQKAVVVFSTEDNHSDTITECELTYSEQLDQKQRKTAKHIIKRLKEPKMAQEVLFALAYAMTSQQIKSIPAYLNGLVNAANNGTFTAINESSSKPQIGGKPLIPIWQGHQEVTPTAHDKAKTFINGLREALRSNS